MGHDAHELHVRRIIYNARHFQEYRVIRKTPASFAAVDFDQYSKRKGAIGQTLRDCFYRVQAVETSLCRPQTVMHRPFEFGRQNADSIQNVLEPTSAEIFRLRQVETVTPPAWPCVTNRAISADFAVFRCGRKATPRRCIRDASQGVPLQSGSIKVALVLKIIEWHRTIPNSTINKFPALSCVRQGQNISTGIIYLHFGSNCNAEGSPNDVAFNRTWW